ncbi:MAG: hypothetical protein QOH81_3125 [Sphingomonadales bacterium]|jgi:hypothetical protein|nr:hypothetical protein [Sphingomonadales bacterium]
MRQHDLSFANFVLRFGLEQVMMDYMEEIVLPAFTDETHARRYGETTFRFYHVQLLPVGEENGVPVLAISGHLVKDTVLRRQQIFRRDRGLVEDEAEIESAPSSFFVLLLNNHRLLYFAETAEAPSLESFKSTTEYFLRHEWHKYVRRRHETDNVTRRGAERLTIAQVRARVPPPVLAVTPVAGQDAITDTIRRFRKIRQIRFILVEPNDELDASKTVAAVEQTFRPLEPTRLEVLASGPRGLNKDEAARKITEISEGQNTEIIVDGEDDSGLKMKADNDEFALVLPIENPPENDTDLTHRLVRAYERLVADGKVRRLPTPARVLDTIRHLAGLL